MCSSQKRRLAKGDFMLKMNRLKWFRALKIIIKLVVR